MVDPEEGDPVSGPRGVEGEEINPEVVDTKNLYTESRLYDVIVWENDSGVWYADSEETTIASGTNAEEILQSALDSLNNDTGTVYVKRLDPETVSVTLPSQNSMVVYDWEGNQWYQTYSSNGIRFWSGDVQTNDYQGLLWYPEARGSDGADADVQMIAHHAKANGSIDKDWSIYTADSSGQLTKRVDLGYGEDLPRVRWRNLRYWGANTNEFHLKETKLRSAGETYFHYAPASTDRTFFLDPRPIQGGDARIRFFRRTSASGPRMFEIFEGNGTSKRTFGIDAQLGDIIDVGDFTTGAAVGFQDGLKHGQRGSPTAEELEHGERLTYVSDGSDGHTKGDLVSARNNNGDIVDQVIIHADNDS